MSSVSPLPHSSAAPEVQTSDVSLHWVSASPELRALWASVPLPAAHPPVAIRKPRVLHSPAPCSPHRHTAAFLTASSRLKGLPSLSVSGSMDACSAHSLHHRTKHFLRRCPESSPAATRVLACSPRPTDVGLPSCYSDHHPINSWSRSSRKD